MTPTIFPDAETLGAHLAARLLQEIAEVGAEGRSFLLGCPTGRTPVPTYRAMAEMLAAQPIDLSRLVLVMMDEYLVETASGLAYAPADAHFSCRGFAQREMLTPFNAALPPEMRVRTENVWFPDPAEPLAIERRIQDAGGIDFFILASGASDGHVAFNPQGTPREARTRVTPLSEQTRADNLATFPEFRSLDKVPRWGVSVGVATIAEAKAGALLLTGESKREAFRQVSQAHIFDADWPATVVTEIADAELLADDAAAG